jgi:hypothetical protein
MPAALIKSRVGVTSSVTLGPKGVGLLVYDAGSRWALRCSKSWALDFVCWIFVVYAGSKRKRVQ